jgi:hypothetical protein
MFEREVCDTERGDTEHALHGGPVACEAVSVRCSSVADTCS